MLESNVWLSLRESFQILKQQSEGAIMERESKRYYTTLMLLIFIIFGYSISLGFWVLQAEAKDKKDKRDLREQQQVQEEMQAEQEQEIEQMVEQLTEMQNQVLLTEEEITTLKNAQLETVILEMQIEMNEVEKITDLQEYYLAYMEVVNKYSDFIEPVETIYDVYSEEEIYLLQRMVETETCGADFESRTHVANVAFNRLADERYPNTLKGVITAPSQFAYVRKNISETTKLACEYAFLFPDNTDGALAFHSGKWTSTFCGKQFLFEDLCGHKFYGEK